VNMFPHTSHVESIGVFELGPKPVVRVDLATEIAAQASVHPI